MKFTTISTFLAAVGALAIGQVSAACPEASRFGVVSVSPSSVSPGDVISVSVDYTCAYSHGIYPNFTTYWLAVPTNNSGYQATLYLERHAGTGAQWDNFTTTIPEYGYLPGGKYELKVDHAYPVNGTNGKPVLVEGGVYAPVGLVY